MAATVTTALPPASPFAKLLRRSRFASFDPQIKQVFSAPPAHAHRGDYGLKRPIPLRRKNSFITLNAPYDAREQFTEWVRGESQVRFIRRFEELDTNPTVPRTSTWYRNQSSKSATEWLADSEFSSVTERPEFTEGLSVQDLMDKAKEEEAVEFDEDLSGLGDKEEMGKLERFVLGTSRLSPNIRAMNDEQFEQFVAKLRKMRPAFRAFIDKNYPDLAGKSLFALSQDTISGIHRRFLEEVTFQEFQSINSLKIEPMPHRNGGLLYHHPTELHSHFFSPMEPGILLQTDTSQNHKNAIRQTDAKSALPGHMVSFAGLRSTIPYIPEGKEVLYDHNSADGMKHWDAAESVVDMRVVPGTITLHQIPTTVGRNAMGVKGVRMQTRVTDFSALIENEVPAFPGTYEYASFGLEEEEKPETAEDKERKNLMSAPVPLTRSVPPPETSGTRGKTVLTVLSRLALGSQRKPLQ